MLLLVAACLRLSLVVELVVAVAAAAVVEALLELPRRLLVLCVCLTIAVVVVGRYYCCCSSYRLVSNLGYNHLDPGIQDIICIIIIIFIYSILFLKLDKYFIKRTLA